MARTASWLDRIDAFEAELQQPLVSRYQIEAGLGVSTRRAQQLMNGLPGRRVGTSMLVDRGALLKRLRGIGEADAAVFEAGRRERVAVWIEDQRRQRIAHPQVLIEAPDGIVNTELADLPAGVDLGPGRISVSFDTPTQALERLLALAMAIGNQFEQFERTVSRP